MWDNVWNIERRKSGFRQIHQIVGMLVLKGWADRVTELLMGAGGTGRRRLGRIETVSKKTIYCRLYLRVCTSSGPAFGRR